jgi:hypothetical protein
MDGKDDSISVSADLSHTIDVLTPQQSGDTSEDSHVLAPRDVELPKGACDTSVTCSDIHDSHVT